MRNARPRRHVRRRVPLVDLSYWLLGDGHAGGFTLSPHARSRAEAAEIRPHYRRSAWEHSLVGHLPKAAEVHDHVALDSVRALRDTWRFGHCIAETDVRAVLDIVVDDRLHLLQFRQRDPAGARDIDDVLNAVGAVIAEVEARAIDVVGVVCDGRNHARFEVGHGGLWKSIISRLP